MPDLRWGEFPDGQPSDMTAEDILAASYYFAACVDSMGPLKAMGATLAADRATMQARNQARVGGLFAGHGSNAGDR